MQQSNSLSAPSSPRHRVHGLTQPPGKNLRLPSLRPDRTARAPWAPDGTVRPRDAAKPPVTHMGGLEESSFSTGRGLRLATRVRATQSKLPVLAGRGQARRCVLLGLGEP